MLYAFQRTTHRLLAFAAILCTAQSPLAAQEYQGVTLVTPSLLADTSAIVPGQPFEVGVLLDLAPGWHVYWEFSGDAGLPTSIRWSLPEGFEAGPIQWPTPIRIVEPGDIQVYGYKGRVMLLVTITPPEGLNTQSAKLSAAVDWLVCEEICVPGKAALDLSLPVASSAEPANEPLFSEFRAALPSTEPPPFDLKWSHSDGVLTLSGLPTGQPAELFPLPPQGSDAGHPEIDPSAGSISLRVALPFRGVLAVGEGADRSSWAVEWLGPDHLTDQPLAQRPPTTPQAATTSLFQALIYGFLGGLILNLMPCVLPVISLKIFGFIRQAGDDPAKILRHGLAFMGGIFAWFFGLAIVVVGIKAAGGQATWAFQFQNPWFNLGISTIVFVFALNLFGVFEIVLPGRAANAISDASGGHGYSGSFFQGVFATLLATPCTAPFLGTALGFAFGQSAPVIFAMFGAVALGMASPYVILSAKPGWMKSLPKPGLWMERLKQFMGFPLIATLLWLLYILGNQKGLEAVIWTSAFLLCLALACWLYGAFCGPLSSLRSRILALTSAALIVVAASWLFIGTLFTAASRPATANAHATETGVPWVEFSQQKLDDLLADGRGVFIDFTADWCITCKVNARTSIERPAVVQTLAETGIVPMLADWTNSNPEITSALAKFGRVGVPFYVIYPPGRPDAPITLPELLTERIVLDALRQAAEPTP